MTKYNIFCEKEIIHSNLTEEEYFDTMQDLAEKFYENGLPDPANLYTEIIED